MTGRGGGDAQRDRPVALTIAGSDSGGCAGVQADLKTMEALGVFGTSAITSVTAQNTVGVRGIEDVSPDIVGDQIDAVRSDFGVGAAKTGMLSSVEIVRTVADRLAEREFPLVVDPVMVAGSGDRLLREDAEDALREELVPAATIVTPNVPEAALLAGVEVDDRESMALAARRIAGDGADAVLVTGGHLDADPVVDVLHVAEEGSRSFETPRVDTDATHGGGCTLSAAIAAELAKGTTVENAVERSEALLERAVRFGLPAGEGDGPVHHLAELRNDAARFDALRDVRETIAAFEREDVSRLVPEVGLNVAVATPYALDPSEVAAIEGRMTRTLDGVAANGGPRLGASSHVARFLLGIREFDERVVAACNLRLDEGVEGAIGDWDTATLDRDEEPPDVKAEEGGTMGWSARQVMERRGREAPDAVLDHGDLGKEPIFRVLGTSAADVRKMVLWLDRQLD